MNDRGVFAKKTMRDVPLDETVVLVRADYNVPLNEKGEIDDDYRIKMSVPTIKALLQRDCRVVIMAHLGRPEGQVDAKLSLEPVAVHLSQQLGKPVKFVDDCIGDKVSQAVKMLKKRQVLLLENVRFHPGEEENSDVFARQIFEAVHPAYFVQDAFGSVHRAHASTEAIAQFVPSVAGLLVEREVKAITHILNDPIRPLVAILGGAKVSDKIEVIERFVQIADRLIIGGAMANTFLRYKGFQIGKSKAETDVDEVLKRIYEAAEAKVGPSHVDDFIILPVDVAVGQELSPRVKRHTVEMSEVKADDYILDIGPKSIVKACEVVQGARSIFWNGTMGYAEFPEFAHGSARIALAIAQRPEANSVVGGGDTADFVLHWDETGSSFSHISTGGGASLELMAGKELPGIAALLDA